MVDETFCVGQRDQSTAFLTTYEVSSVGSLIDLEYMERKKKMVWFAMQFQNELAKEILLCSGDQNRDLRSKYNTRMV